MKPNELDSSAYMFAETIYINEFKQILTKITECFYMLKNDGVKIPLNSENGIRDLFIKNYLKNSTKKTELGLEKYLFDRESSETHSEGRVDIRVMPIKNDLIIDEAYYIIECKRLDNKNLEGVKGLNYKYIEDGIKRFTSEKYTCYYKVNAMIGFIVEKQNVLDNVQILNKLLLSNTSINTISALEPEDFIVNLDFHFKSTHKTDTEKEFELFHLMYEFV